MPFALPSSPQDLQAVTGPPVPAWATAGAGGLQLASRRIAGAIDLPSVDLTRAVTAAYLDLIDQAAVAGHPFPVRFWNYLPAINERVDAHQTRYMAFNAGRYAAFGDRPHARAATASGVGHGGRDLWVHCLASARPGQPVDNPRQVRPDRYSARYGPRPPSFARATRLGDRLLVGGTASICGEQSMFAGDWATQLAETLVNLRAVVAVGMPELPCRWASVRVYHLPTVDRADLAARVAGDWALDCPVEYVVAELCRPELLVEIEGVVEVTE